MATPETIVTTTEVEVRYAETDQMGVVHHANYLVWFELARTHHCRAQGIEYAEIERRGFLLMVVGAQLRYRRSAHYGDHIRIECSTGRVGSRGVTFVYRVLNGDQLLATGSTNHIWVSRETRKPTRIPDFARHHFFPEEAQSDPGSQEPRNRDET